MAVRGMDSPKKRIPSILELCQEIVSAQRKKLQPTICQPSSSAQHHKQAPVRGRAYNTFATSAPSAAGTDR